MIYPNEYFSNYPETTLSADITSGADSITVVSASGFPSYGNFRIRIDNEILLVTGVLGTTFTVLRGRESTVAVAHSSGAKVYHILTTAGLYNGFLSQQQSKSSIRLALNSTGIAGFNGNTGGSNIYLSPFTGNSLPMYLYELVSDMTITRSFRVNEGEFYVAAPNTTFQIFDIFANVNSGDLTLSTVNWNRVTASLSGTIISAYEPTITTSSAHGFSTGDIVTFTGVGTGTNQIGNLINNRPWNITVLTSTTFKLQSCNAASPYINTTGSGTCIKLNNTRATALSSSMGIYCKSGAIDYRYLGTAMTWDTAGYVYDTPTRRHLWNIDNQVNIYGIYSAAASHNLSGLSGFRIWNLDYDSRISFICGLAAEPMNLSLFGDLSITSAAAGYLGAGLNTLSYSVLISGNVNGQYIFNNISREMMPYTGFNIYSPVEYSANTATLTNLILEMNLKG